MADNTESVGSDAQSITFKVKTSGDGNHTITMLDSSTVLDLKTKLATEDYENIPVERQRLIYSGRVLKNDETLASYKIKPNNTVHMVKSAASNPGQPASSSTPSQALPTNMASGTANNPLAGLTGARYAGHQLNLPGMDAFGPDGGMGPPMDDSRLQRMMEDPNIQQTMNEALNNPQMVDMLIQTNPMLRNMPNARQILTSPMMRQMMTNPNLMREAMRMQRSMRGGGESPFPAPGPATDAPTDADNDAAQQNPFATPFAMPGFPAAGIQPPTPEQLRQMQESIATLMRPPNPQDAAAEPTAPSTGTPTGQPDSTQTQPPANPFAALFPPAGGDQANPFGMNMEQMQQMLQMMGGQPQAPADTRPPEERFANELRQLNDMGFFDFDRNVTALRRSGGSVQGAVEYLLSSPLD